MLNKHSLWWCALAIQNRDNPRNHDDVIKWKHFPRYWPFVRGIHRSPVNSPHKGQWRGALMFSLICPWINDWVNNSEAGDLKRHRGHYDVNVMICCGLIPVEFTHSVFPNQLVNYRIPFHIENIDKETYIVWYIARLNSSYPCTRSTKI